METTYQGFVSLFNKLTAAPFYWSHFLVNSQHERINKYKAVSDFQASWPVAIGMLWSWLGDNNYNYLLLSVWTQSSCARHRFVVLLGVKIKISVEDGAKSRYIFQPLPSLGFLFHPIGITPNFK